MVSLAAMRAARRLLRPLACRLPAISGATGPRIIWWRNSRGATAHGASWHGASLWSVMSMAWGRVCHSGDGRGGGDERFAPGRQDEIGGRQSGAGFCASANAFWRAIDVVGGIDGRGTRLPGKPLLAA